MDNKKIAILGNKGMLGSDLTRLCLQQQFQVSLYDLPDFDITKPQDIKNALTGVDTVINCAAYTNVEKAETEKDLAFKINADAVGDLGKIAKQMGIWVLHISTDFVFDGNLDRPYNETDPTNPINIYGQSKLQGEKLLADSGCDHCILRIEWTYGTGGNNFVSKIIESAKQGNPQKIVDDQVGSPTPTTEVSKAICRLIRKKPQGIFHFASAGYVSRFEMAKFVFDNLKIMVNLSSCKSSGYASKAKRPLNSRFDCKKISALLDEPIEHWQVCLEKYLRKL